MAKRPFKRRPNYSKRRPLWTPAKGITQSGLTKFLECPEQFALSYIEGHTSRKVSKPLEFGNLFHLCCEFQGKESPEAVALRCTNVYIKSRRSSIESTDYDELQRLAGAVRIVFPLYVKNWEKKDKLIRWVSREKAFSVPYSFQDHNGATITINLVGKRDGVYYDPKRNLCLFETKTKSEINSDEIRDGLRADFQTLFYLLALRLETGKEPYEVLYNVVRRPGQRLTKSDTLASYLAKIEADIKKRPNHYFARWHVTLSKGSLDKFCRITLDPALRNFLQWWRSIESRPFDRFQSPSHLLNLHALTNSKYGRSDLYDLIIRGKRSAYSQRSIVFPELRESTLNAA